MRKIASVVAASVGLRGTDAACPDRLRSGHAVKAVVVERNENDKVTNYKLQNADPMTGRFGYLPLGDGGVYAVKWTKIGKNQVNGTGKYTGDGWAATGTAGQHPAYGSNYKYTKISITLAQSWYGTTKGSYGLRARRAPHNRAIHLAVNDPTTNLIRY